MALLQRALRAMAPLGTSAPVRVQLRAASTAAAAATATELEERLSMMRNIGISAHIDSGKTTLTERVLYYTGRIREIHEVRGKDGVGAVMDSMALEREKGITIQSAATHCEWDGHTVNIIDTPGHVDFTIEVERALRVLDGAVLVLCGVSGVQSQTLTVDRQMRRYNVPRISFVNKLDRAGADPFKIVSQIRDKLRMPAAAIQIPIGLEDQLKGVVDLIDMKAITFAGDRGERVHVDDVPDDMMDLAETKRAELIESLADVDDELAELFLEGVDPSSDDLRAAIRRATLALKFSPVMMGSAFKNVGVQPLLDGVVSYLPNPMQVENIALDQANEEAEVVVAPQVPDVPPVALAFKLEEGRFGQLTLKRGDTIVNVANGRKIKVPRLVQMHSNEMQDVQSVQAGDIAAMFGVDCRSGDTFTDGSVRYTMTSMHVPEPVMSLSITPAKRDYSAAFSKALQRFQKEDPTFRVRTDPESGETVISGMGELHLEIYSERIRREYGIDVTTGKPQVAYRETITAPAEFNYTHKKQSGGAGQFGRVIGSIEPIPEDELQAGNTFEFNNQVIGGSIPSNYIPACEKGFRDACDKGTLIGFPIIGVRVNLTEGMAHAVDSSEMAFRLASLYAFRSVFDQCGPRILEPIMSVVIEAPAEFQGTVLAGVNRRKGLILNTETEHDYVRVEADVPLENMFGYSTDLRSTTQGKGEFTMEYKCHSAVPQHVQAELIAEFQKRRAAGNK